MYFCTVHWEEEVVNKRVFLGRSIRSLACRQATRPLPSQESSIQPPSSLVCSFSSCKTLRFFVKHFRFYRFIAAGIYYKAFTVLSPQALTPQRYGIKKSKCFPSVFMSLRSNPAETSRGLYHARRRKPKR